MIYFIQEGENGPVKVGKGVSPEARLKQLQTGNPRHLKIYVVVPGYSSLETKIKKDLAKFQINGEWFSPTPELFEYIDKIRFPEYEIYDGKPYAILWRDEENASTDHCPFCGKRHTFGTGDGHSVVHCSSGVDMILAKDGTNLIKDKGYIIRTRERSPKKPLRQRTAFAIYHNSPVYHIACLTEKDDGFDETLCNKPLTSRKGVNIWDKYKGGCPTPIVVAEQPDNKKFCRQCANMQDRKINDTKR